MNFTFNAAKNQAAANPTTTVTGTPAYSATTAAAGDAGKALSSGFSLSSVLNQPKTSTMFGSPLAATTAASGTTGAAAIGTPTFSFGTTPTSAVRLTFGVGSGATSTPSFGAAPFTAGGGPSATTITAGGGTSGTTINATVGDLDFGFPKTPATTSFSLGSGVATPPTSTFLKWTPAVTTYASANFTVGRVSSATGATPATSTAGTGFEPGAAAAAATPHTGISLGAATPSTGFSLAPGIGTQPNTGFPLGPTTAAPATSTASSGFSLVGATATPSTFSLGTGTTSALASGFSLAKTTTTQAAPVASTTNATPQTTLGSVTTVSASSGAPAGTINFCTLEESINKWTLELEEQEKAFVNQATQVNAWDKLLIANGERITTLNQEVERVKLEQQQLEHELDYVVGQQKELQDCLVPLEKELATQNVTDPERDYTYRLAENLDRRMKQMSQDLKEIIEHLNEGNRLQDSSDPIVQIAKILNAHMNSLQWLDQRTSVLAQKIQQIDQMHQSFRQENERSLSLAYN